MSRIRRREALFWLALVAAFAFVLDLRGRYDAERAFGHRYIAAHGCRVERGIPYRVVCP